MKSGTEKVIDGYTVIVPNPGSSVEQAYYTKTYDDLPKGATLLPPAVNLPSVADAEHQRWMSKNVWLFLQVGLAVPASVLIAGAAFIWAFRGFHANTPA